MYGWDPFQYQITKYVMRWKDKHTTPEKKLEDLKKARSFLDKYISVYEQWLKEDKADTLTVFEATATTYTSDVNFLAEGGYGDGSILYTCKHCQEKVAGKYLSDVYAVHRLCRQVALF